MKRILVIEDNEDIRTFMQVALEGAGFSVTLAQDGAEGLDRQREAPADVVITDIFMPDKDGIETIFELRQEFPQLKIIAVSGGGDFPKKLDYLSTAIQFGAVKSLSKPFDSHELLEAVNKVLAQGAPI
jgi:two-component system chemotaxis response regulator CheY